MKTEIVSARDFLSRRTQAPRRPRGVVRLSATALWKCVRAWAVAHGHVVKSGQIEGVAPT